MASQMTGLEGPAQRNYAMSAGTLHTQEAIWAKIQAVAKQIAADYAPFKLTTENPLVLVCVLKGSLLFTADLSRFLADEGVPVRLECICASSYGKGVSTSGQVRLLLDVRESVEGRHVLIVEDIVDSATTLVYLMHLFGNKHPASLKTVALIDKPEARQKARNSNKDIEAKCRAFKTDYTVLDVPDVFIIGYGMDFSEAYRELRDIVILKPEYYEKPSKL